MLTYLLIGLILVVAVLVIVISMRPNEFRISRSAVINAPPERVFSLVNDFHNWEMWSPWAERDPQASATFEGPATGEGAKFSWVGNKEVGEGKMLITESTPHKMIAIRIDFLKPFKATNTAEFEFEPVDGKTKVTWSMFGKNGFLAKAISLIVDCDTMVGKEFEQGLTNLNSVAETGELANQA